MFVTTWRHMPTWVVGIYYFDPTGRGIKNIFYRRTSTACWCCCCCRHRCRRRCFSAAAAAVVGGETRRRHDNRARRSSNGAVDDAASFPQPPRPADSRYNRATSRSWAHSCRTRSPVETRAQSSTMRCSDVVVSTAGRHRLHHHHQHLGLQLFVALLCLASGKSHSVPAHNNITYTAGTLQRSVSLVAILTLYIFCACMHDRIRGNDTTPWWTQHYTLWYISIQM